MTEEIRCSSGRLSSPFQGSTAHPHMRAGAIKGALKKAHPETKTGWPAVAGGFTPKSGKNQQKKMIFGAWNVRTLLDRDAYSRPERRTAHITREFCKYQIDIAAPRETKLAAQEDSNEEPKGGYTFF